MQRIITLCSLITCLLLIQGCRTIYPVSTGSHAPFDQAAKDKKTRFVVWSNHPGVANTVTDMIQQKGYTVVERARIMEILNEQKIQLTHSPDDSADVLRVGRLVGADRVVFAEATVRKEAYSTAHVGADYGGARSGTVYHLSVSVRSVAVETGEIRWSGNSYYPGAVGNPEQGLVYLTQSAVNRALCPIEDRYEWQDGSSGCVRRNERARETVDSY